MIAVEKKRLNLFKNYGKLEDNITHGFISTLKILGNDISRDIVKELTGLELQKNIFYDIQSPSIENIKSFKKAKIGFILGISSISAAVQEDTSERKESRADGWISDGDKVILIESKLMSSFSKDQLKRHKKKLEGYGLEVTPLRHITWQRVDSVFDLFANKNKLKNQENDIESTILSEFRRYLQMEGLTLNLEKFFNAIDFKIEEYWYSEEPKTSLRLLKKRVLKKLEIILDDHSIEKKKEKVNETKMNFYWLRLFEKIYDSIKWRGTLYLNPDHISVDIFAFEPKKSDLSKIVNIIENISKDLKEIDDKFRTYIYAINYGKRTKAQQGIDYEYEMLTYNLEKSSNYFKNYENLVKYAEVTTPKHVGIKYVISNPGSKSISYWKGEGESINHRDAKFLKNPRKIVEKFVDILKLFFEQY
ncbi:MAG: hypothetical protein ACFFCM_17370 [Promethearchaeota archaeon]